MVRTLHPLQEIITSCPRYNSTEVFDWDPVEKRAELFHRDSRFLLVAPDGEGLETDLVAYSMFRFDVEEDMEGKDQYVLYWHVT